MVLFAGSALVERYGLTGAERLLPGHAAVPLQRGVRRVECGAGLRAAMATRRVLGIEVPVRTSRRYRATYMNYVGKPLA